MGLLRHPETPLLVVLLGLACALLVGCAEPRARAPDRPPLGVLGDSDSHAYQDRISFPDGGRERGGAHRAATLQWTEVLFLLRGREIDPGDWGEWGTRGRWAGLLERFGIERRSPRKQDHEFNYAWSGATCADLNDGIGRQVPRLIARMDEHPEAWRRGAVILRIGINDLGTRAALDGFARDGDSAANRARVDACLAHIRAALDALAASHPETSVVIVGVLDNVDWPRNIHRWVDAGERANIRAALDRFDDGLRVMASTSPRWAFFDDRAFYAGLVGARDAEGRPAYRPIEVRDAQGRTVWSVAFAEADTPDAMYLADGHAGTVLNAHWAQAFASVLHANLGLPLTPISDNERDAFLIGTLGQPSTH